MTATTARKLGQLTDRQRAAKLARAAKLQAEAAELLAELYDDRRDQSYRMTWEERNEHGALASAADRAAEALRTVDSVRIAAGA